MFYSLWDRFEDWQGWSKHSKIYENQKIITDYNLRACSTYVIAFLSVSL